MLEVLEGDQIVYSLPGFGQSFYEIITAQAAIEMIAVRVKWWVASGYERQEGISGSGSEFVWTSAVCPYRIDQEKCRLLRAIPHFFFT